MIEAILLDLDNTLISNPDHQFAVAFLKCIDEHFQKYLDIQDISVAFRKGIKTLSSRVNQQSNTNTMIDILADATQLPKDQVRSTYQSFYIESYPALQSYTSSDVMAHHLITYLMDHDLPTVIATNPLYPTVAIHQRLRWAGLADFIEDFVLITSSDNMHVAKPNLAYYTEILGVISLPANTCLMVGDSIKNDIQPVKQLGMQSYHITAKSSLSSFYEHVQLILGKQTQK